MQLHVIRNYEHRIVHNAPEKRAIR